MTVDDVRRKYLEFFAKRGHVVLPSASLVPENDPTTLFTSSGMQPLVPYLRGQEHPSGQRLTDSQKCFRSQDIEEVGDNRHTTFFEMLGNWSLGDYFKKEQLTFIYTFLTDKNEGLGLDARNLYFTTFSGDTDSGMTVDTESVKILREIGISNEHIFFYGAKKNWWSRAGVPMNMPVGEIGGPDCEVFYDFDPENKKRMHDEDCHPNCDCGRFMEIGNSVFMQFVKNADKDFDELPKKNVDFGGGLERMAAAVRDDADIFNLDVFEKAKDILQKISSQKYISDLSINTTYSNTSTFAYRVILDHIRAATFLISDGVFPGNKDQNYFVRRLIRRAVKYARNLNIQQNFTCEIAETFIEYYSESSEFLGNNLQKNKEVIFEELEKEEFQFRKTLSQGMRELEKMGNNVDAFLLFTTYGFPIELTAEIVTERGGAINVVEVKQKMQEHQALSRSGSAQKFAGGLADHSEQTIRYHTTHHILLKALQIVLGNSVHQCGSNITSERLRIDFSYHQKMSDEQKREVEKIVNEKIAEHLPVIRTVMKKEEAEKLNAEHEFGATYPDQVSVYSVGPLDNAFSIEFCGGPHVSNTSELGAGGQIFNKRVFKIIKEEASSSGIRRIKAVLE